MTAPSANPPAAPSATDADPKPTPPGLEPGEPERLDAPDLPAGEPRGAPRAERPGQPADGALKMPPVR